MIRLLSQIQSATIHALDRDSGTVTDYLLSEDLSRLRYLVVDVGSWKPGGRALVPVVSVSGIDVGTGAITLNMGREEVLSGPMLSGPPTVPQVEVTETVNDPSSRASKGSRVTSARLLAGCHIQASDNQEVGHVDDFLVDPATWAVDAILIDTSNAPGGKWVTIAPRLVSTIDWADRKVFLAATGDRVRNSPEYQEPAPAPGYRR